MTMMNDPATLLSAFSQPNLTNEGFKERQGDAPNLHWVDQGTQFLWKKTKSKYKKQSKIRKGYLYDRNSNNKIEIQLW